MKGILAYLRGVGIKNVRPAVYAWFFNFLFTVFIYYGYYKVFSIPAGNTLITAADGTAKLSTFTFLTDILQHYKGSLPLVFSLALVYTLGFFVVSIYVSAGVYTVLVENEKTTFTNMVANSTQNFFCMLNVSLINILTLIAALIVPALLMIVFVSSDSLSSNETVIKIFGWVWAAITALFLMFAVAVYDFSRIFKLRDDKNTFYSFKQGIRFTFSNKLNIFAIFVLYALSLVIIYLVYAVLMGLVQDFLYVIILFMVYQGFIMVRYYLKIVVMRAEIRLLS
ncbi:MAG: hypothetical protein GY950_07860 [bacterium]|nr:hypothetical protein [bacterium]